jgi:hypothetical protein
MEPEYSWPRVSFVSHNGESIIVLGNVMPYILSEERNLLPRCQHTKVLSILYPVPLKYITHLMESADIRYFETRLLSYTASYPNIEQSCVFATFTASRLWAKYE